MIHILKRIFHIIFFSKKEFKKPPQNKILIFDEVGSELIRQYFPESDTHILHTREESINLFVIFFNFLKGKISKKDYFNNYIECVNPKIIISTIDNNPMFFQLSKKKEQKKILISSTIRTPVHDGGLFSLINSDGYILNKSLSNNFVDIVFTLNKEMGNKFRLFNVDETITIGSFKSNHFNIEKKKDIELLYISSWAGLPFDHKVTKDITFREFDEHQLKLLNNISVFGFKNKIKITILGKMKNSEIEKEYDYYNKIFLDKNWEFLRGDKVNSYNIVDRSNICLTLNSTLGYESFSRGNKTIFFDTRSYSKSLEALRFAWPNLNIEDNGFFWTKDSSLENLEKILKRVIKINDLEWKKILQKYHFILPRDENNLKFKNLINELL